MLRLKMATDPSWANVAEENLEFILSDHAFCEQKAASNAITFIVLYPEYPDLVAEMVKLSIEEMEHFKMVNDFIVKKGFKLGFKRKNHYVNKLGTFFPKTDDKKLRLVYKLLFSAMIEARSCERFHVLSLNIADEELAKFYHDLEQSEARHYATFINFAKDYAPKGVDVEAIWEEFRIFEGDLVSSFGKSAEIHG